jgi:hypothetical protein
MRQSRLMSLVEAAANVVVGYAAAVATQALVFPLFGLQATLGQNLAIGAIFTGCRSRGATRFDEPPIACRLRNRQANGLPVADPPAKRNNQPKARPGERVAVDVGSAADAMGIVVISVLYRMGKSLPTRGAYPFCPTHPPFEASAVNLACSREAGRWPSES